MDLAKELIMAVKRSNSHGGYGLQKECEALVGHVLNNMVKSQLPPMDADTKNDEDSAIFREEGNQCFVSGDDEEAIEKYSMSLAYAKSRESKSLALANRSAALYRKQLFRECLIDIDAALDFGYPEEKRKKLKERAEKALEGLTQLYQMKDLNMNDLPASKDSKTAEMTKDEKNLTFIKELIDKEDAATDEMELISKKPANVPRYLADENDLKLANGPSDEAPSISDGIKIAYSEKYGRHLIATKPFEPGEILLLEKPYANVIYREKYYTHCHYCLARSYNLIPCPHCPLSLYCSENCRTLAWSKGHEIECPIQTVLSKLLNLDKDKIRILTKIIRLLLVSTEYGTAIDKLRKDSLIAEKNPDNRTAGFTDDGVFESSSSRSALSLATNLAVRPLMEISAFACISALAIILLAKESKFFGKKYNPKQLKDVVNRNDVKYCASLVFRNCVIVSSNSFSVQQEPGVKAGSGLYLAGSLMNHACSPNTFRHFDGLTMITRALEPIKAGDQIFTCYGGGYQYMSRGERKKKMMDEYFFDCQCQSCVENWPTYQEILRNHVGSIAKTNKDLVEKLKPFRQRLLENKYDIGAVKNVLKILYAEVKMPCEEIVHAIQYLKSYYLGKFHQGLYIPTKA
ncbi:hypothetical protein TSAR_015980 [Trichomalopsis sarcophagae]|uniref:SET and MYND domain-containing protein 4 n=1 Tax=Trichomalopsis sarcophagae TaxID=543379 RepID=A0A232FK90_9HYME|nr:hypothetical protein TSAR_015980 [Trichomalopsis sarcophagae]